MANVFDSIDELSIRRMVLPKVKLVFEKNITDPKIVQNVLMCIERVMDRMERMQVSESFIWLRRCENLNFICLLYVQVMEEVLPLLANVRIPDPDIIMRTVRKYGKR